MINTICNGIRTPRLAYTKEKREELLPVIESVRKSLREEYPSASHDMLVVCGSRFEGTERVFAVMESVKDQDKLFEKGNRAAVRDALLECMRADYDYMFEKDWGDSDEYYTDDDVDEE
ncbi:MAG: hypothetical protein KBT03_09675 [Bacteroidales bacterium]|nr:hypothetical protein [Candidatus Scybalousia scybalohippi]